MVEQNGREVWRRVVALHPARRCATLPLLQGSDVRVVGLGFDDTATVSFEAAAMEV